MKHRRRYGLLLRHFHLLRASMNLAHSRSQQLDRTIASLGFSAMPRDPEAVTRIQVQAAQDIGGVNTRMLLDAPMEMEKFHFGPLQVALCLLCALMDEYARLIKVDPVFLDDSMDAFRSGHEGFLVYVGEVRDSLLHERYDNTGVQGQFAATYGSQAVELAIESCNLLEQYLTALDARLRQPGRSYDE